MDKSFVAIDEFSLDKEWVGQPVLYDKYARKLANARRELEEAKNRLEVVKAEQSLEIRARHGEKKPTEAAIATLVTASSVVKDASQAVVEARHAVDVLTAATTALDHRKKALENLVQLHLSGYYANPKAPDGDREVVEEMEKREIRRRGMRRPKV